jgi:hypothetical protein
MTFFDNMILLVVQAVDLVRNFFWAILSELAVVAELSKRLMMSIDDRLVRTCRRRRHHVSLCVRRGPEAKQRNEATNGKVQSKKREAASLLRPKTGAEAQKGAWESLL